MSTRWWRVALILLACVIAALAIASVRDDTATVDERAHIASGLVKLRHGWLSFYAGQAPLMNVITALPLSGVALPPVWREGIEERNHWHTGRILLYESGNDARAVLFRARLPTIALLLVLCFTVYFVVRAEAGEGWAVAAFALTGFCPTLLAHGRLATVDVGMTAFLFLAFALFLRLLRRPSVAVGAAVGAAAMAAMLAKTSAAIVAPFFVIVIALHVGRTRLWRPLVVPLIAALLSSIVTLYAVTFALASEEYLQAAFPDTPRLLVPWLQYQKYVEEIRFWYGAGHEAPQFLLGEFSRTGWPHYYLVAFLLKTPIAAQLLFVLAVVVSIRRRSIVVDACLVFVAMFFLVTMGSRIALGLRYVLPIYPFLYTATAIALSRAVNDRRRLIPVAALVVWHCASSVAAWPGYLSYFNALIGSHRNADRFLIDSNLDWGQDLHRLRKWADANGVAFLYIDYFGGGDVGYEFGARAQRVFLPGPKPLPPGWFAVSRHKYRATFDPEQGPVDYDTYLAASKARYVTTVGGSIDVYRVH